jgi:hypothetical protein
MVEKVIKGPKTFYVFKDSEHKRLHGMEKVLSHIHFDFAGIDTGRPGDRDKTGIVADLPEDCNRIESELTQIGLKI